MHPYARSSPLLALLLLTLFPGPTLAFDCRPTLPASSGRAKQAFDLTPLDGLRSAHKETDTPPTRSRATVRMRLCGEEGVGRDEQLADEDQVRSEGLIGLLDGAV